MGNSSQLKQKGFNNRVIVGVLIVLLTVVGGWYFWQRTSGEKMVINTELTDQKESLGGVKTFAIPEVGIEVVFPSNYSLALNSEKNRRGSFVSYDFSQLESYKTPYLYELQFFSEESIRNFIKNCQGGMCFEGDYPDLTSYSGQKTAFGQGVDYQDFKLKKFGDRDWFVSSNQCVGDRCVIREYTTFIDDTKIDVWIMMSDSTQEMQSDMIFSQFGIE